MSNLTELQELPETLTAEETRQYLREALRRIRALEQKVCKDSWSGTMMGGSANDPEGAS
jgi:hypothetical protein